MNEISLTGAPAAGALPLEPSSNAPLDRSAFLKLLTTQLQNQNPLDPLDSGAFVEQLATFSSVEQLLEMSSGLEAIAMGVASLNNASMASLLGKEVTAVGDRFQLDGDSGATLGFELASAGATGTLHVYDSTGRIVATRELGSLAEGEGSYEFDGMGDDGDPLPAGEYRYSVEALDSSGNEVEVVEIVRGVIDEMSYESGVPQAGVGGSTFDLADIRVLGLP